MPAKKIDPVPGGRRERKRTDRSPEWIRQACRNSIEGLIKEVDRRLASLPDRKRMTMDELLTAIDKLGRYGVGTTHRVNPNDLTDEQIIRLLNADAA